MTLRNSLLIDQIGTSALGGIQPINIGVVEYKMWF